MQISKRQLNTDFEKEIKEMLAQVVADLPSKEKAFAFLHDFLTETEYIALAKRLAVMLYLTEGRSYEAIKKEVKVSSATIASVQSAINKNSEGYQLALQYLKAEAWATKWTEKITGFLRIKPVEEK